MINTILDTPLTPWMVNDAASPIVLSSRIRLARNFGDIVFPQRASKEMLQEVDKRMRSSLTVLKEAYGHDFSKISIDSLTEIEREILVEKHLISPAFVEPHRERSLIISSDSRVAIMVNEEDHLRIQAMYGGLALKEAYKTAILVDDALESKFDYAFSNEYGYATACPTNVGTGMRASVLVHVPALAMTGKLQRLIRSILQLGYSVRGLYGEGSEGLGNMYQISNQRTMGISEEDTIAELEKLVQGIVKEEEKAREALMQDDQIHLEDRLWRSYGVLKEARLMSGEEALSKLSDVQLGRDLGILPQGKDHEFLELIVITRPNFLTKYAKGDDLSSIERDKFRALMLRNYINK